MTSSSLVRLAPSRYLAGRPAIGRAVIVGPYHGHSGDRPYWTLLRSMPSIKIASAAGPPKGCSVETSERPLATDRIVRLSAASSRLCTPRSRAEQGWDCRSVGSSVATGPAVGRHECITRGRISVHRARRGKGTHPRCLRAGLPLMAPPSRPVILIRRSHEQSFAIRGERPIRRGAASAHAVRRRDEARQLGSRVVRCDPRGAMPKQILPILEAHPGCSQASPKGMLQIVHAHLWKFGPYAGALPGRGHHVGDGTPGSAGFAPGLNSLYARDRPLQAVPNRSRTDANSWWRDLNGARPSTNVRDGHA